MLKVFMVQVEAFGANRWDTAEFADETEKEKFIKLMVLASALC